MASYHGRRGRNGEVGRGVGLVLHAWNAFFRRPLTESDVEGELRRHRR
ncbi:MAG TPA: hypothetical protein VK277_11105 [Acidimicrobiales bacterium]|nr:hypothetical protein [Acidimicrobiales bacterium]